MKGFRNASLSAFLLLFFGLRVFAQPSTISATISTYAGPQTPVGGVLATTQTIDGIRSVFPDGAGGFYVSSTSQNRVYRVASDGQLTIAAGSGTAGFSGDGDLASSARLNGPRGIVVDAGRNLFIADAVNQRIRKVTPGGIITTVAGNGTAGSSGDGGAAISAQLSGPFGIAVDNSGNLLIAESGGNRIRKVTPSGIISTIAGIGIAGFTGDGALATAAQLRAPNAVSVDVAGNLLIADTGNNVIRKVTTDGTINTFAGTSAAGFSGDGGMAASAQLNAPNGLAIDADGNILIADTSNNRVRKVTPTGTITTLVGGTLGFAGDGGQAASARLNAPSAVAVDLAGSLLIADLNNQRVRRVNSAGFISTAAGNGLFGNVGDGGQATAAFLNNPMGVAADTAGNLFVADFANNRIRKISRSGVITTVAGTGVAGSGGDGGPAISAQLNGPTDVAVDAAGNLYVADSNNHKIRKITQTASSNSFINTIAGSGVAGFSGDGGPAASAQFDNPLAVEVNAAGDLFVSDRANQRIRKIAAADSTIVTVAGTSVGGFNGDGILATGAQLNNPWGLAVDTAGNLFVMDSSNQRIRKITPEGIITTVAGTGVAGVIGDGGPATSARLSLTTGPLSGTTSGIAVDARGNIFIADRNNSRIRRVTPAGVITTFVGGTAGFSGDGGSAALAQISVPNFLAFDPQGNLFITERGNNRIRKITFSQQISFSIADGGGFSLQSSGNFPATAAGYGTIQPNTGSAAPSGLAIFGFRQNNVLVSEAGVPASPLLRNGRIYAEVNVPVNTGLAMANPNNTDATVSFFFTDANGNFGAGTTTIAANGQIAAFLNQAPFNAPPFVNGTLTFSSSVPIAVVALRGFTNERGEFLITTLPVADLTIPASIGNAVFPNFSDGGGWSTQIILVNPGDSVLQGTVQFFDPSGQPATVTVNGQSNTSFAYSIPPRSSQKLQTSGVPSSTVSGSVRAVPAASSSAPSGLAIFSFRINGTTISEAGVSSVPSGTAFRFYAEAAGAIQTGLAIANLSASPAAVTLELNKLDGSSTGLTGTLTISANGQVTTFLNQIQGFESLPIPFQGVLRVSSPVPISPVGLRGRYNERGEFLITTTPPVNEAAPPVTTALFFPYVADSGGYNTQFILYSGQAGQSFPGTLRLFSAAGGSLNLTFQ